MKLKKICILLLTVIISIIIMPITGCASNTVKFNKRMCSVIKYDEIWVLTSSLSSNYLIIKEKENLEDLKIFFNDVKLIKLSKTDKNEKTTEEFMYINESTIFMMELEFKQAKETGFISYSVYIDSNTGYIYDLCLTEKDKENEYESFEINYYYKSMEPIDLIKFKNICNGVG